MHLKKIIFIYVYVYVFLGFFVILACYVQVVRFL